ncbi:S8 family peptidase [Flavobacterium agricola]|uniref:S8 family peptidase n=1 Tax=Flavobacterium agricola TaxID=2870839 RepID=A0ABY6LZ69_9FLAO|nr:S8 family peptidase [Flavobacterium agricola]UYW01486.1 S8 family peptidase [Flavobacterium agricola]
MSQRFTFLCFTLGLAAVFNNAFAQQIPANLATFFKEQKIKQDSIFDAKFSALPARSPYNLPLDKSKIAQINDSYILFLETGDVRANKAANVDFLQNGTLGTAPLMGEAVEIAVFDGGKVFGLHEDFLINGKSKISDLENNVSVTAQPISAHATGVSGLIAANGNANLTFNNSFTVANATRGVIPSAKISTASFQQTSNGTIYEKILKFSPPISNHSYGSNFGWAISSINNTNKTVTLVYPVNTSIFLNDEETFAGIYLDDDANYDMLVYNNPKTILVKSAGNYDGIGPANYDASWKVTLLHYDGSKYVPLTNADIIPKNNSFNGAYSITTGSLGKNILTVGSIDLPSAESDYRLQVNNIIKSSFSSVGPRKDGAIKPDLVAVGAGVAYPGTEKSSYMAGSGTSFAAPKVTGVIGALTQLQRLLTENANFLFDADQAKTLLLHTTQEAGLFPGPDNKYGWGALDAKNAVQTLLAVHNKEAFFIKEEKINGTDFEKIVSARANDTLKVTLSWIDLPFTDFPTSNRATLNDRSTRLIHDLDVRLIDTETETVYYPWKLDMNNVTGPAIKGDNAVDNIEQIVLYAPEANRNYKVVVTNKGSLISPQSFSLLITGANEELVIEPEEPEEPTEPTDPEEPEEPTTPEEPTEPETPTDPEVPEEPAEEKPKHFRIFPTVTSDVIYLKGPDEVHEVHIFDLHGKRVTTASKKDAINVSHLTNGLYVVKIKTANGQVINKKIIKK